MQKAIITGASKRIGKAIALELAKNGCNIVLHYNNSLANAQALKQEIISQYNNISVELVHGDLTSNNAIKNIYSQITGKAPNILINNASVFEYDDIFTLTDKSFTKHINTNLKAPLMLAKEFAKKLGNYKGDIINIIDQKIISKNPYFLSYTLSKTALNDFTQIAAMSLAPNIKVNAISPGLTIKSNFQTNEEFEKMYKNTLLEKNVCKKEIANAVMFILKTPHITGQNIVIDSGQAISHSKSFLEKKNF